jgi:cell division protein FtsA
MRPEIIGGTTLTEDVQAQNGRAAGGTIMTRIADRMKAWFDEL